MEQKVKKLPGIVLGPRAEHRQILLLQRSPGNRLRKLCCRGRSLCEHHHTAHRLIEPVDRINLAAQLPLQKRGKIGFCLPLRAYADRLDAQNQLRRLL